MRCCANCAYHQIDWGRNDEDFWTPSKQVYCQLDDTALRHDTDSCPKWTWDHAHQLDLGDAE
jgi:hypothetical protein